MRIRRHRLAVNPPETRRRALRSQLERDAFAAVARVALDLSPAVPVEGEVGVDADAGWGGRSLGSDGGGAAGPSGGVVFFVAAAGPGIGFADGACVALGWGPGCWVEEEVVGWLVLWGGEVGG